MDEWLGISVIFTIAGLDISEYMNQVFLDRLMISDFSTYWK
jgi:hypothetical protein